MQGPEECWLADQLTLPHLETVTPPYKAECWRTIKHLATVKADHISSLDQADGYFPSQVCTQVWVFPCDSRKLWMERMMGILNWDLQTGIWS